MTKGKLCILLFFSILIACEPVGNSMDGEKTSTDRLPSQESWNTMIRINSVGKENVQARAAYSAHYDDPREILFIGDVQLDFFNEEGKHSSTMSADTGRIDDKRHLFTATGSVFVVSDSGMTLATSILYWNESKEAIFTDQPIVLTTESDTLFGIGFESNSNLTNWTITQPTGVTYREIDDE